MLRDGLRIWPLDIVCSGQIGSRRQQRRCTCTVVLAVPVAAADALNDLEHLCEQIVCLHTPKDFVAVGAHYVVFDQTSDDEVSRLLREAYRISTC